MSGLFIVTGKVGVVAIMAHGPVGARRAAERQYGMVEGPFVAVSASLEDMREHLRAGCVFFNKDFTIMEPAKAYALAEMPLPNKFASTIREWADEASIDFSAIKRDRFMTGDDE